MPSHTIIIERNQNATVAGKERPLTDEQNTSQKERAAESARRLEGRRWLDAPSQHVGPFLFSPVVSHLERFPPVQLFL